MISLFRQFTKTWVFAALIGVMILSFAIFGMNDVFTGSSSDKVISTDSRSVSAAEYKTYLEQIKNNYTQRSGKTITNEEIVKEGQHLILLEQLADKVAMGAWLEKLKIKASPEMIVESLAKIPQFQNPITLQFDKDVYRRALMELKLSEKQVETDIADQIASDHFISAVTAGLQPPKFYSIIDAAGQLQIRDVRFFTLSPKNVPMPALPNDAQLKTFYEQNKAKFEEPEIRQARLIRFVADDLVAGVSVDEASLKKMYEFRKDSLSTPETRNFLTISAPNQKAAEAIAADLRAGLSADVTAKTHKGTLLTYPDKPKTAIADSVVADTAFKMQAGEVSPPIKGSLGLFVIKMVSMSPGKVPSLEEVRAQLEPEYKLAQAKLKLTELTEAYQEGHDNGQKFDELAQKLGLKVFDMPPMYQDGRTLDPNLNMQQFPEILKSIYSLSQGAESGVESMGQGQFFAVKILKVKPAGVLSFDTVKPQLTPLYMQKTYLDTLKKKSDQAYGRLNKGEAIEKVAASLNAEIVTIGGVDMRNAQQKLGDQGLARAVFSTKSKSNFTALSQGGMFVGRIDAVKDASPQEINALTAQARLQQLERITGDLGLLISASARKEIKLKTHPQVVLKALDIKPETDQSSSSKAK